MNTNHSLEVHLAGKHQMFSWLFLLLMYFPVVSYAQPPVTAGDCSRSILEFDGVDDEVSVSIPDFSYVSGTVEAWVRKDNWQDPFDDAMFSNGLGHNSNNSFYVSFHPAVGLHFRYGGGSDVGNNASYSSSASTSSLAANSWHHVAATWHNDGSTTTLAIYLDGSLINTTTAGNLVLDGPTTFGISKGAFNSHYVLLGGSIAEMRVWNVARSESEIANNKDDILSGSETGLIAYWPLDDGTGSSAANLVSGGSSGTLENMDASTAWVDEFPISISSSEMILRGGSFEFGTQLTNSNSAPQVFTISNNGNTAVDLTTNPISALSGTDADQFDLDLTSTVSSIPAGGSTTFSITFSPDSEGEKNAAFSFASVSGCSDAYTFDLTGISSTLETSITVDQHVTIYGTSDGQLTASASGGTSPYAYLWSNGGNTATIADLSAGTYTVTVTDAIGAQVQTTAEVTQPDELVASIEVISNATSIGGNEGELTASATGGVEPYAYSWSNGANTANISGLTAGDYVVTITDDNGATAQESVTITEPLLLQAGVQVVTSESAGRNIGELSAYGLHGFPPYSYLWSTGATTQTLSGLDEGIYTVTVTDSEDYEEEVTINLNSQATISYSGSDFSESYLNDGSVFGNLFIELEGDLFSEGDDVLDASEVNVNLPSGLSANIAITERNEIFDTIMYYSLDSDYESSNWQTMAFGNGTYVALTNSSGASAIASNDGVNWVSGDIQQQNWYGVTYAKEQFVAVSGDGYSSSSTDGVSWSEPSYISDAYYYDVIFANGFFVAVASGQDSSIMISEDGVSWVEPTSYTNADWRSVTYGSGQFVAVDYNGDILISTDGKNWMLHESVLPSVNFQSIAYGDGIYVACSSSTNDEGNYGGEIWSSSDGENWTIQTVSSSIAWEEVIYDNGLFLVLGEENYEDDYATLFTSPDGVTWTDRQLGADEVTALAYGNGRVVVLGDKYQSEAGDDSNIFISQTNAKAKLTLTGTSENHQSIDDVSDITFEFSDLAFTNTAAQYVTNATGPASSFVGINFDDNPSISYSGGFMESSSNDGSVEGSIVVSLPGEHFQDEDEDGILDLGSEVSVAGIPDGLTPTLEITEQNRFGLDWLSSTASETLSYGMKLGAYGNGTYVALSYNDSRFAYSTNGETWTFGTVGSGYWNDVIYADGLFVAVGEEYLMTSSDGINWSNGSTSGEWNGLAYGNGKFVAVEGYGVMHSTNGINWTEKDVYGSWQDVAFGNDIFVAVGTSSTASMYSEDGQNWVIASDGDFDARMAVMTSNSSITSSVYHIAFGGGLFVAIGSQYAYVSSDGVSWSEHAIPYGNWNDIVYANGHFYIGGTEYETDESVILRSMDGSAWESAEIFEKSINGFIIGDKLLALTNDPSEWLLGSNPSSAIATLTISGSATNHSGEHSVADITFDFDDSAFANLSADNVYNSTGPASSGLGVTFYGVDNDDCTSAESLTVNASGEGDYISSSTEFALIPESYISCASEGTNRDVWFQFTMPSTGSVEISSILGSAKSLSGAVYTSCGSSSLFCVADLPEKVYLPIGPGVPVLLQVFTSEEEAGSFSIRVNEAPNTWSYAGLSLQWSAGAVPQPEDDALILSAYSTEEYGSLEVNNLNIYFDSLIYSGKIEVASEDTLIVNGDLENSGLLYVSSGASLLTYGDLNTVDFQILDIYGEAFLLGTLIERNTPFNSSTGRYSIVGSPVELGSFDSLGAGAVVYAYDESAPYHHSGNQGLNRFATPAQLELVGMEPGVGYFSAFTGDENGTVWFTGTPNHGTVEVDLSYTDQGSVDEEPYEGFNLVSNPYPAAISVAEFLSANGSLDMDQVIYIWDDFGSDTERGTNADYLVVNSLGNTGTNSRGDGEGRFDGFVRSAQGFFVKANASGQTLQFTDEMKVAGNNTDEGYFRKSSITSYKLGLSNGLGTKATIIGYPDDATLAKDKAYDARYMGGSDLQWYTMLPGQSERMAIQGLPSTYAGEVALGFSTTQNTQHAISLINQSEINEPVWLLDQFTGKITDLSQEEYAFITEPGTFDNRFVLMRASVLQAESSVGLVYAFEKTLYINSSDMTPAEYYVFNLSGQKVKTLVATGQSQFELNTLKSGVYLVSNGTESVKVVLK